ncbi:FBD-like protein [Artemisia annua]|uniref:FBD-like protein n=1 Tax=Artemisia annua TaxID=35608 RepID=A0A2U1LU57_ARTAN|nr:FBD-like protein [Artemisia annua]
MTSKNKRKNGDRLSDLPKDILTHVLSLLPLKLAVRTSILSKRWRYIWMLVPNLDFDNVTPYEAVDHVLELCKSKVEILRLHFNKWPVPKPTVSKWINEAIRLNVSELDILVREVNLPLSFFTCKTLTTFRLTFQSRDKALACPSLVSLPCLKTLDIVVYSNPLENTFKLIHGCPILENLSLEIKRRESEENYYFEIPTLKRLTLSILRSIKTNNRVVLNLPNLEYLSIRETWLHSLFVIKDLSSLVEAKASCDIKNDGYLWFEILKGIRRAKCLSLNIGYYSFRFINPSSSSLPEFPNVKQLELIRGFNDRAWWLVPKFLERCPELKHFIIHKWYGDCPNEEPESVPSCMLANLKTIKVTNTRGSTSVLKFLKFMLANSKFLKTLTVTFHKGLSFKDEGALSQVISRLPRASEDCEFHFEGK